MNKLSKKQMRMEAFLATPHSVLLRYGSVIAVPLVAVWLLVTLPIYGMQELPQIGAVALLLGILSAAGAPVLKLEYRIMSLPGVQHTLPANFTVGSLVFFAILVIMADSDPQFLAMGRLVQTTVLAGPALVFIPALVYDLGYRAIIHRMVMHSTTLDFAYLVGARHLQEQLAGIWQGPQEFGEPLSLMLLQFRPQDRGISPAAPKSSEYNTELVEQALAVVDQNIRKNDTADQFSSDSIWIILGRTGADSVSIPKERIRSRVTGDAQLAPAVARAGLEVVQGVASYRREMRTPAQLIQAAEEALIPQSARLK